MLRLLIVFKLNMFDNNYQYIALLSNKWDENIYTIYTCDN